MPIVFCVVLLHVPACHFFVCILSVSVASRHAFSSVFTVRETTALFYLDIPNIPPTVADAEDYNKNEQRAGCDTPNGHHKDGEIYSSNSTGIRPTSDNQCVMCICQVFKDFRL